MKFTQKIPNNYSLKTSSKVNYKTNYKLAEKCEKKLLSSVHPHVKVTLTHFDVHSFRVPVHLPSPTEKLRNLVKV